MDKCKRVCKSVANAKLAEHVVLFGWFFAITFNVISFPAIEVDYIKHRDLLKDLENLGRNILIATGIFCGLEWLFGMAISYLRYSLQEDCLTSRQIRIWVRACAVLHLHIIINRCVQIFLAVAVVNSVQICVIFSAFLFLDVVSAAMLLWCEIKMRNVHSYRLNNTNSGNIVPECD